MFSGNDFTPLEIMDSKLSSALNAVTWSIGNVKMAELSRMQKKALRRSLTTAQDALVKTLKVIDMSLLEIDIKKAKTPTSSII